MLRREERRQAAPRRGGLVVSGGDSYLSVFNVKQLQALALLFLNLNVQVGSIALVFFGLFQLLIGYLIFRSTFLPRILGALIALAGLGWLIFSKSVRYSSRKV